MPSFYKVIEISVSSHSKRFCSQVQQTAAFDKLRVTILLLSRLCLGEKNQLDNKSVRGFAYFITFFNFWCYFSVKKPKTEELHHNYSLLWLTQTKKRWVSDGCHELHPLPLLSLGRSLCSFFLTSGYSLGRVNKEWIFFEVIFCIGFLFCISRKEKTKQHNIEFWLTEC